MLPFFIACSENNTFSPLLHKIYGSNMFFGKRKIQASKKLGKGIEERPNYLLHTFPLTTCMNLYTSEGMHRCPTSY